MKQPLFPKEWAEGIVSHLWFKQSDLKIRMKCQTSTRIQNQDLTWKKKTLKTWRPSKCKKGVSLDPGEGCTSKLQGWWEKQWVTMGSICRNCTCLLTSPRIFWGLLWSLYGPPKCWPKTSILPDISSAKMGLFGISRGLQFGICNHMQSPSWQGKENTFIGCKRIWEGCSKQRVHSFSLAESLPGKKRSLSPSCWVLLSLQGMRVSYSDLPVLFSWDLH